MVHLSSILHKRIIQIGLLFIFFLSVITYSSMLLAPFIWDDQVFIIKNTNVQNPAPIIDYLTNPETLSSEPSYNQFIYRPLRTWLFATIYRINGADPLPFHLVNILLHALTACLIPLLLLRLKIPLKLAFVTAAIFAIHPIHTEAVSWVSSLADPLFTFFTLISLLLFPFWPNWPGRSKQTYRFDLPRIKYKYAFSFLFYFIALLAKEMAATLPLLLTGMWIYLFAYNKPNVKIFLKSVIPFYIITIIYIVWRFYVLGNFAQESLEETNLLQRIIYAPVLAFSYLKISLAFWGQNAFYGRFAWQPLIIMIANLSLLALIAFRVWQAVNNRWQPRALELLCILFLLSLTPALNILPLWVDFAERFVYWPSLFAQAIFVLGVWHILQKAPQIKNKAFITTSASILLIVVLIFSTWQRNKVWQDDLALWQDTAEASPKNPSVFWNLGLSLQRNGQYLEAAEALQKAFGVPEVAYRIPLQIGQSYLRGQKPNEALEWLNKSEMITNDPIQLSQIYDLKAQAFIQLKEPQKAVTFFRQSIAKSPANFRPYLNLAQLYVDLKDYEKAKEPLQQTLNIKPNLPRAIALLKQLEEMQK